MITSLFRQNDVATSFWRNNDVIITSCQLGYNKVNFLPNHLPKTPHSLPLRARKGAFAVTTSALSKTTKNLGSTSIRLWVRYKFHAEVLGRCLIKGNPVLFVILDVTSLWLQWYMLHCITYDNVTTNPSVYAWYKKAFSSWPHQCLCLCWRCSTWLSSTLPVALVSGYICLYQSNL